MKFLPTSLLIVILQALVSKNNAIVLNYNCSDSFLISQNCVCSISATRSGVISMTCGGGYLTNNVQNTLPPISTTNVPLAISIPNTYTMFPTIPVSYYSKYSSCLAALAFSYKRKNFNFKNKNILREIS